jgi:DnaJ-class molecular chaperone
VIRSDTRHPDRRRADFALLGAPAGADEAAIRRAFLDAVKAARPDQGGDPERYREIIAAYNRLQSAPTPPEDLHIRLEVKINAELARTGGHKLITLPDGRRLRVKIPSGIDDKDILRLSRQGLNAPGRWGDVYLTLRVAERARVVPPRPEPIAPNTERLLRRFQESWAA